jgi:RecJ-like exonuclease
MNFYEALYLIVLLFFLAAGYLAVIEMFHGEKKMKQQSTCPSCKGRGRGEDTYRYDYDGYKKKQEWRYIYGKTCQNCGGTGQVTINITVPNTPKIDENWEGL